MNQQRPEGKPSQNSPPLHERWKASLGRNRELDGAGAMKKVRLFQVVLVILVILAFFWNIIGRL